MDIAHQRAIGIVFRGSPMTLARLLVKETSTLVSLEKTWLWKTVPLQMNCRTRFLENGFSVQVPEDGSIQSIDDLIGKRVAT
ncbi:hypothetical protein BSLG_006005 [Batrachochytrium salamandrivorans]|nr:hypothetical protein BSLG_006005 [Batrachochytrium salamandrivorans]